MRWTLRLAVSASFVVIILLLLLKHHLEDLWGQYRVGMYIATSWKNSFKHGTVQDTARFQGKLGDKVIIMAKLEQEDTDWVSDELPEYAMARSFHGNC